jgi:hypothetical protein
MNYISRLLIKILAKCSPLIHNDKLYIKFEYLLYMGKKLKLKNPQTYNEKLQWLKLYDRKEEYSYMVDKIEAKKKVAKIIGEKYIIPTLGIFKCFEDINFEKLPNQFVIKCTHNSGGVCICTNKKDFNIELAKKIINKSLHRNYFWNHREYPYKHIVPQIIIEKYITSTTEDDLKDYKFFCFNGVPKLVLVASNRQKGVYFDFFDMNFNHCPFRQENDKLSPHPIECPPLFEEMKKIAATLSTGYSHIRIDLYTANNKIYFGEYTFFNNSGYENFIPKEWDLIIGNWINLPPLTNKIQ